MGVRIIRGAISSGKSGMCLSEIEKIHSENSAARCVMIVPDHYSYETERCFVARFGGTGLNNIEVMTLRRMAMNTLTASQLNHLTGAGRQMLIHKAVQSVCDELEGAEHMDVKLISSMRCRGFLDVASSLISEMKRYMITPAQLREKSGCVKENETLQNKLTALSLLYERYTEYVGDTGRTDSDDDLAMLAACIERGSEYDENTYVWIDRFDFFMPQQIAVIEALLKRGAHVCISVCYPADKSENTEIYSETLRTLRAAQRLAEVYGSEGSVSAGRGLSRINDKSDLKMLFDGWNDEFVSDTPPQNIKIFQARDTYSEAERIACEITELTRSGGMRYRDIAVMLGDENEYLHLIEAIFGEYGIPYFTDRRIILSDHPIAMQIMSLFRVIEEGWSYESVMSYLRAGFIYRRGERGVTPIDQDDVDLLENFVLKHGIRGAKKWLSEETWLRGSDIVGEAFGDEEKETEGGEVSRIDELRRYIAAPIEKFASAIKGGKTAAETAAALFEYMEDINLYSGLKLEISRFKKKGMQNEAEQFTQIWNLILDVLAQTAAALGDDILSAQEYADYMSVGLSKCEISIIPSGIDTVYVGSPERLAAAGIRVIFAAGARSGTYPLNIASEGFLSDRDRNTMSGELNITIAPDTRKKTEEQYFKVYRALCSVTDKLYLSYSVQNEEGNSLSASQLVTDILRKFPKIKISHNLTEGAADDFSYISSPKATMHRMLVNLSARHDGRKNPLWDIVREWYADKEEWQSELSVMDRADYYSRRGIILHSDAAKLLYEGRIKYSASRINTFARCPFEYFLKYGLGAMPRDEWAITPANMGSYAHRVIYDFCVEVEKDAGTDSEKIAAWRALTDEDRDAVIGRIIDDTCAKISASSMRDKEKTVSVLRRMGKTVSSAAALVQKSLASGDFAENGMERVFETEISEGVSLRGLIDRIDTCEKMGEKYFRIVDYKTGRTEFDIVNIANGYNMQMAIYALAVREEFGAKAAGIYYTGIKNDYTDLKTTVTEDNIREYNEKSKRLDGVTFAPEDKELRLGMLYSMDNGIIENGESSYAKIKINGDGETVGVRTPDEIEGLMEYVREYVLDMDSRARSGEISLSPYEGCGRDGACAYCDYAAVCKFDEDLKVSRKKEGVGEEIWETMKVKGAAMRGVTSDANMDKGAGEGDI